MNILCQVWSGPMPEIVRRSTDAMEAYAKRIGAAYCLLENAWDERLSAPCQKLTVLSRMWEWYDRVAMVDADMFPRLGLEESLFDLHGYGIYHPTAHRRVMGKVPHLTSPTAAFFGGAIYVLPLDLRQTLRRHFSLTEAQAFDDRGKGQDEGIMHCLARKAGLKHELASYFGQEWARSSYEATLENSKLIHIRHHDRKGNAVEKPAVLRSLQARGIIA